MGVAVGSDVAVGSGVTVGVGTAVAVAVGSGVADGSGVTAGGRTAVVVAVGSGVAVGVSVEVDCGVIRAMGSGPGSASPQTAIRNIAATVAPTSMYLMRAAYHSPIMLFDVF